MRLTYQMKEEMLSIAKRVRDVNHELLKVKILALTCTFYNSGVIRNKHRKEMQTYKIKLENLFSETDDNGEKRVVLLILLQIKDLVNDLPNVSDDFGRYTTMGLQIAPNDPYFNHRKENYRHLKSHS